MVSDPANEPNFYAISSRYPLDCDSAALKETLSTTEASVKRPRTKDAGAIVPLGVLSASVAQQPVPPVSQEVRLLMGIMEAKQK